jgi:hypothetical protein
LLDECAGGIAGVKTVALERPQVLDLKGAADRFADPAAEESGGYVIDIGQERIEILPLLFIQLTVDYLLERLELIDPGRSQLE